jgi:two-component system phosphate regulon sensor histidine kinase PhoR
MAFADRVEAAAPWVVLGTGGAIALTSFAWDRIVGVPAAWGLVSFQSGIALALALGARFAVSQVVAVETRRREAFLRRVEAIGANPGAPVTGEDDEDFRAFARAARVSGGQAAQEVARSKAELATARAMLEAIPDGVLAVGPEGRITFANAPIKRLLGVSDDPVGQLPAHAMRLPELQVALEAGIRGERRDWRCTWGPHDLVVRSNPLDGSAMAVVSDVTGFRDAERARTEFVANVSHELRTPITAIQGYAETLMSESEQLPPELKSLLETIDRNARRLSNLFEDLLKLHRIEVRRKELPLEKEPLLEILEEGSVAAAEGALRKHQRFRVECPESLEGFVNAEAFETIVSNLASNAVAYTDEGGEIIVRAFAGEGGVPVVEVVDSGIGIDPVLHDRIFERFFRVDEGRSRRAGGTGLGLAIVKHLALATGCRISLESVLGKGTTFRIQLPESAHPP